MLMFQATESLCALSCWLGSRQEGRERIQRPDGLSQGGAKLTALLPDRPRENDVVMSTLSPQVGKPWRPPVQN